MDKSLAGAVAANPEYRDLVRRRERFAWTMAAIPAVLLVGFLACLAWNPALLGRPVFSVFTVGMLWALAVIGTSVLITWFYLHRSERVFDPEQRRLLEQIRPRS